VTTSDLNLHFNMVFCPGSGGTRFAKNLEGSLFPVRFRGDHVQRLLTRTPGQHQVSFSRGRISRIFSIFSLCERAPFPAFPDISPNRDGLCTEESSCAVPLSKPSPSFSEDFVSTLDVHNMNLLALPPRNGTIRNSIACTNFSASSPIQYLLIASSLDFPGSRRPTQEFKFISVSSAIFQQLPPSYQTAYSRIEVNRRKFNASNQMG
ncbi:hypothetical protein K438DRAFT_1812724, partial [Mycena galopus ATCC 62051]